MQKSAIMLTEANYSSSMYFQVLRANYELSRAGMRLEMIVITSMEYTMIFTCVYTIQDLVLKVDIRLYRFSTPG